MDKILVEIHESLGITEQHILANRLTFQKQPPLEELEVVDIDFEGKSFILISSAAEAWRKMQKAAEKDQIFFETFLRISLLSAPKEFDRASFEKRTQDRRYSHSHRNSGVQ